LALVLYYMCTATGGLSLESMNDDNQSRAFNK
jgi:hypothetical protein